MMSGTGDLFGGNHSAVAGSPQGAHPTRRVLSLVMSLPAGEPGGARWRTLLVQPLVRRGVIGAVVTMVCLGLLVSLATPPFLPYDESPHVGYALELADGRIPNIRELVEPELPGQRATRQHTANHPPLYHVVIAPVLEWGAAHGHPIAAVRLVRWFSLPFAVATVVLTAVLAGLMSTRRRTYTMVLSAGLVATLPAFVGTSVAIHNDLLAVASGTVAYVGAIAALSDRPRPWTVALVCIGASVTMATRLNGIAVVGLACLGLAAAAWLRTSGTPWRRLARAAWLPALPALCVIATSGWFHLRNIRVYGDIRAAEASRALDDRVEAFTEWGWLTDRLTYPDLLNRVEGGGAWRVNEGFGWYDRKVLAVVVALVGLGVLMGAAGLARRRASGPIRSALADRIWPSEDVRARLVMWGLAIALPLVLLVQLASHVAGTGTPNPRYLFPGLPVLALMAAIACRTYPGRTAAIVGTGLVAVQAGWTVTTSARWITSRTGAPPAHPLRQLHDWLVVADVPAPWVVLGVLLTGAAAGVVLQFSALWPAAAQSQPDEPSTGPTERPTSDDGAVAEEDRRHEVDRSRGEPGVVVGVGVEDPRPPVVQ